jgi:predicted RNA-binding protein with RPS1 domain
MSSEPDNRSDLDQPAEEPRDAAESSQAEPPRRRKILIGSQRDPAAYRPRPKRDQIPVVGEDEKTKGPEPRNEPEAPTASLEDQAAPPPEIATDEAASPQVAVVADSPTQDPSPIDESLATEAEAALDEQLDSPLPAGDRRFPPPNIRGDLSPELEAELEEALGDVSLEEIIDDQDAVTKQPLLESETKLTGRIVMIRREDVFVEIGGREQGIVPLKQFSESPEINAEIQVVVNKFNLEDGLYELNLPHAAASIGDWSDLDEGMIIEVRVTGHNTGGLECEVNHIRGFIPVSQISLYRVEDLEQFADEKFTCLVTEANPDRRNLVLSRRAVLEREREEARQELLKSLAPGQIHEGVVRKLMDFGAFVDLGGVDGLLHISQLAWGRVNHPSEVLSEGQTIKVRVDKVDPESGRISLAYRDMMESPWVDVDKKYPVNVPVHGKVTKLMDFGAFVELEPGVEGLVHISELSHKRVWRVSDAVKEGEEVDVLVQSVDTKAQRIGLSMKGLIPEPASVKKEAEEEEAELPASKPISQPTKPLKGGLRRKTGGEQFGLKW